MQEVTFNVETITPLFLAGADYYEAEIPHKYVPRGFQLTEKNKYTWQLQAELRPPAFRGLMRYWQRTLIGGIVGTDSQGLTGVREVEQSVFGTTVQGSAIGLRVTDVSKEPVEYIKDSHSRDDVTGKDYLLWSMAKSGNIERNTLRLDRKYFPLNTTFKIILSSHEHDVINLNRAIADLWLLTNLGGIGSRSRRCAGSLVAKPLNSLAGDIANLSFKEPTSVEELCIQLRDGIKIARSLYPNVTQRTPKQANFDVLAANTCAIWILRSNDKPWHSAIEAMNDIGEKLHSYRENIKPPERRAVFGLPLSIKGIANERLKKELEENRQASPLHLKITKLRHEYVCVAVLFKTMVQDIPPIPMRDYTLIDKWITMFPKREAVEL